MSMMPKYQPCSYCRWNNISSLALRTVLHAIIPASLEDTDGYIVHHYPNRRRVRDDVLWAPNVARRVGVVDEANKNMSIWNTILLKLEELVDVVLSTRSRRRRGREHH